MAVLHVAVRMVNSYQRDVSLLISLLRDAFFADFFAERRFLAERRFIKRLYKWRFCKWRFAWSIVN